MFGKTQQLSTAQPHKLRFAPKVWPKQKKNKLNHMVKKTLVETVDGWNPAPVEVGRLSHYLWVMRFYTSQAVVWDFSHQQEYLNVEKNLGYPSWWPCWDPRLKTARLMVRLFVFLGTLNDTLQIHQSQSNSSSNIHLFVSFVEGTKSSTYRWVRWILQHHLHRWSHTTAEKACRFCLHLPN